MNAPETIKPATQPINLAHEVLLKADEALCIKEVACAIFGGDNKPKKSDLKDAGRLLKQLADLGLIEMERVEGVPFYRLIVAYVAGDSEGGETDAPAAINDTPKFGHGLSCGACHDGCAGEQCKVERDSPPIDAQRDEFTLLGLIADIRAAAGDPTGKLMQDELVQHIAGVVKERDLLKAENLALKTLECSMPGFGAEFEASRKHREEMSRVIAELQALRTSHTNAINEADRLRAELATERQAREALQEQSGVIHGGRLHRPGRQAQAAHDPGPGQGPRCCAVSDPIRCAARRGVRDCAYRCRPTRRRVEGCVMDRQAIMSRALRHGFTLRQQPGGEMDLNPYVYAFAREMFEAGWNAAISAAADRCEAICHKYMRGDGRKSDAADECKDAVRRLYRDAPDCDGGGHAGQQEREEAEALCRDAERYRSVRRGQKWSVIDGIGNDLRGDALDAAIDAATQRTEAGG